MYANLGYFLLLTSLICAVYALLASSASALLRHKPLYLSARLAVTCCLVLTLFASAILWNGLFARDFSVLYIMKNSSLDLPALYTFTAFWSSLEGSHFLWTLLLVFVSTVGLYTAHRDNAHMMPYVTGALSLVLVWMYYLLVSISDPFLVALPQPANGQGMNELLQNPYMAIHPPLLFAGYVCLAIPFSYGVGALCYGDVTQGWLRTVRRWTLISWCLLTAAITLGGRWAYVELGWAGYWAWDPVENSSFLPWLAATALLHSGLIQDRLGHLKRLGLILAFAGFYMSFFGTFITRSGVVSSVHSFAQSPIGPNYLIFLAVLLAVYALLYLVRSPSLVPPDPGKVWGRSKESVIAGMLFLTISFGLIVLIGTLYPIASEAVTGQRTSVQAPYFNRFAPWVGLAAVLLMAFGHLMRYRSGKIPAGPKTFLIAGVAAIPMTWVLGTLGQVWGELRSASIGVQVVGIYALAWTASCLAVEFIQRARALGFSARKLFVHNTAWVGAWVAHMGFLVLVFGFLGNYRGLEHKVTMMPGDQTTVHGYQLSYDDGIQVAEEGNAQLFVAPLRLARGGHPIAVLRPARSKYPTKAETFNEIAVHGTLWHDLYVVLADFDRETGKAATLQININPTVRFVWLGVVIMVLGGVVALFDRHRGNHSRDVLIGFGGPVSE